MSLPEKGSILVTGGAGYIGSHTVLALEEHGYDVVVADDLSRGHRHNVRPGQLREVSLSDEAGLRRVLAEKPFHAVMHFAAYIAVGESSARPELYFSNNLAGSLTLLDAVLESGIRNFIFSSTAAVYGVPSRMPITEDFPYDPVNPYGETKAAVERILHWYGRAHELRSLILRYFNAAGADPAGRRGEEHEPETHLIPLVLRAASTGSPVTIFGDDYPTPDGTCVRDYVHVSDLADAHVLGLESLLAGGPAATFNVGTGRGYSVREVIRAVEEVTGKKVPCVDGPRRAGDAPVLVASSRKLRQKLGWQPRHSDLLPIVRTAWAFANR